MVADNTKSSGSRERTGRLSTSLQAPDGREAMKTVFIGAGRGCRAVLELFDQGRLTFLNIDVMAVVDVDVKAPAMMFARQKGWKTLDNIDQALALDGLELVIELTGSEEVLDLVIRRLPPGVKVLDHTMAGIFWDLLRLEAHMATERAELQEILDTIPDVVMVVDREKRILRVNRRFEEVVGKSRRQVEGRAYNQAIDSPQTSSSTSSTFSMVIETGAAVKLVQRRFGGDKERHFQLTANPVRRDTGEIVRVVQTEREITEQVQLKRETEDWARRFRQIVDAVHGIIITIKDLDERYQLVNPWAERVLGIGADAMIGRTAHDLFPSEVAKVISENDRRAMSSGDHVTSEEHLRINGRMVELTCGRFMITDHAGRATALCCVALDETRARQLQRDLIQTERLSAMGKLAAGVAHELNNPLTGILSFSEDLLDEAEPDDPARQDYEFILNETLRCRRIVRDLLDFSRQKPSERAITDINHLVRRSLMMVERQASFQNVTLDFQLEDSLPQINVDAAQIQQAILNLVINARDAMEAQGKIAIESQIAADGRDVILSVTDTGVGISEKKMDKIFDPFFSTKGDRGNGLGLPAVQSIVEQHGGRVEVSSQEGIGSTFRLVLPVVSADRRVTNRESWSHQPDGNEVVG